MRGWPELPSRNSFDELVPENFDLGETKIKKTTKTSQESKQETEWEFAEIWADTLISPPYILMLVKEKSGIFCIHNPAQNYKVIFSSDNYESAKMWLLEDEYERLNSRILQEV